jgi:DDE superfamily endonuclease
MTTPRRPCPPAPGPLEDYAAHFDDLFASLAQRQRFREYLAGLLLPRDRNKTLTALAGAEPLIGAGHRQVQALQWFLSESTWDAERINARRLTLLRSDPVTAPHAGGVVVVDDTGDRKDGHATAHVAYQYLGSIGKIAGGIVAVTTLWADERVYYPLHLVPYTPAARLPGGKSDPAFRTKPELAVELIAKADLPFRAVVADCFYGDNATFTGTLHRARLPYVLALKPHKGTWAPAQDPHTPIDAARVLAWNGPKEPGDWTAVLRHFRDGHTECWWAADATLVGWGPDRPRRLVVATTDPAALPAKTTWYLTSNLPRPGGPRAGALPWTPADLAEIVRIYGLRTWVEQGYKQVKDELGWADFQVRSDTAIRRHWTLVCCAFSFCWRTWFAEGSPPLGSAAHLGGASTSRAKGQERGAWRRRGGRAAAVLAGGPASGPGLVDPGHLATALVAGLVEHAPAC